MEEKLNLRKITNTNYGIYFDLNTIFKLLKYALF